ncbi:GNAT family N-acetyltransferase [Caldicellulosiruptoraceae bacterium PP1]
MIIAKGENINIRELTWGDLKLLQKWYNDPEVAFWALGLTGEKSTIKDFERWYKNANSNVHRFIIELKNGFAIGSISYRDYDINNKKVTLGIHIGEKNFWGKGLGTEATKLFIRYLFDNLDINRIELDTFDENVRAIKAYQKCGFKIEGVLREAKCIDGKFHDKILMGLLKKDFENMTNNENIKID